LTADYSTETKTTQRLTARVAQKSSALRKTPVDEFSTGLNEARPFKDASHPQARIKPRKSLRKHLISRVMRPDKHAFSTHLASFKEPIG